jgi:uncharacterized repeat protein (TIGR01451 family)
MGLFSKIGLGIYYRLRRMKKALKNWRKFGVIIFGSILVASTLMPAGALADDLRVEIYKGDNAISSLTIDAGTNQQFTARAFVGSEEVTTSTAFTWSMSGSWTAAQVGSVTQSGLYTAGSQAGIHSGALRLVGTYSGKSDLDTVSVYINVGSPQTPVLTTLDLTPVAKTVDPNKTIQFTFIAKDQFGAQIAITNWQFAVTNANAGTIDQKGLFLANKPGFYPGGVKVTVTYGGVTKTDTADVTVNGTPPPQKVLDRVEIMSGNNALSSFTIDAGANQQFQSKAYATDGSDITANTIFTWSMSGSWTAAQVGSVTQSGLYTAGSQAGNHSGALRLVGTYNQKSDLDTVSVYINVTPPPPQKVLDRVEIMSGNNALSSFTIDAGTQKQFSTKAYATDGSDITANTIFTWSMSGSWTAAQVGSVTQSGLYTAGSQAGNHSGALRLVGTYNQKSDLDTVSVYINVTPPANEPPHAVITANPTSGVTSLVANLNASASTDSDGAIVKYEWDYDGNGTFDFNSGNDATVTHTYGVGTWYPKVRVTDNDGATDIAATATAIVVEEAPAKTWTLGIDPDSVTLTLSGSSVSRDFNPIATYNDGSGNVTLTSTNWQVIQPGQFSAGGTINANGLYTAYQTGYDQIKLTASDGTTTKEAWASVSVIAGPQPQQLAYVVVNPPLTVLDMHATQQFTATAYDQNNQVIGSGVSYNWNVIGGGGSINSATGLFTAGDWAGTFDHTVRVTAIMNGNTRYGYATVIVNPFIIQAVLDRVEILPPSVTISRNDSYDFAAYAYNTNNVQMFSDVTYTWSVLSGPGYVDQNGVYTATSSDNTATIQVEARQGNIRVYDTAYVYISTGNCSGILDRVVITPQTGYVHTGNSMDFDAQAYDTTGCLVSADLYFSLNGNVPGSINNSGYFTANYTTGTYDDGVRVRAYKDGREVYDWATVVITSGDNQNYYIDASLRAYDETIGSDYRANEGDTILYTLKLTNNRNNSVTGVTVTMEVPDYTNFSSVTSQSGTPSIYGRTVTWNVGSLYSGESKTLWLRVRVKDGLPSYTTIRGKAFVKAYEIGSGFWVYSNDLPVNGTGPAPIEPLTPTGALSYLLAAIVALLATIFTRQLMRTRRLLAQR